MKLTTTIEFYQDPTHFVRLEAIDKAGDGSGFSGLLCIQSEPFGCNQHHFYFESFKPFCKEVIKLNKKLKGSAGIGPTRDGEFIKFEGKTLGHINVSGELRIYSEHSQTLKFAFLSDQSYLGPFVKSAESVLNELKKR